MKIHTLKAGEPDFTNIKEGVKTFDVRPADLNIQVGDLLMICQYINENFTGYDIQRKVTFVQQDCEGVKDGYVVLGLEFYEQTVDSSSVPVKVLREGPDFLNKTMTGDCPHCGKHIVKSESPETCSECGCPLIWSDTGFF